MIVNSELTKLVELNELFKGFNKSIVEGIVKPKNFLQLSEGTIIFQHDDVSSDLYLIIEGDVKIKFAGSSKIERKYLLDFFGEKEILDNTPRKSVAIANKNSIVYKISAKELTDLSKKYSSICKNLKNPSCSEQQIQPELESYSDSSHPSQSI